MIVIGGRQRTRGTHRPRRPVPGRVWRWFRGRVPPPPKMRKVFKRLDLGLDSKLRTGQKRERLPGDVPGSLELLLYLYYFTKLSGINM